MSLIWTRAAADWAEDQSLFPDPAGVVRVPCVRIAPKAHAAKQFDVYVLVSANAAAHFALPPRAEVHTFGAATAAAAERAGARVTRHAVRTAAELAPLLLKTLDKNKTVGVPGAAEPAFDLAGALTRGGLVATAVACYQTEARATDTAGNAYAPAEASALVGRWRGVVCFASPSAVRGFVATFPAAALTAACIGPTTAEAAQPHFQHVVTAAENSLAALVACARAVS